MPSAQERAFARLASRRGLLEVAVAEAAIERAGADDSALPQLLVSEGAISPKAAGELLRELSGLGWGCGRCAKVLTWTGMADLSDLSCPQPECSGEIVPIGEQRRAVQETIRDQARAAPEANERTELVALHRRSGSHRGAVVDATPTQRRLGPYALLRELGRGSNGVVYLAERDGAQFALKALKDSDLADEETIARFQLEAAVAQKIDHRGVIRVHEVGRDGDRLYSVMDYCPGRTLKELMRAERVMEPERAAEIAEEIAWTLEATHRAGVIHRDIKPSNIILEPESGRPRLTDFGLARDHSLLRSMTHTGDILGTPYYMAPEQFRGERELDHRVDIYALGVILYQCLTGQRPHDAATPMLLAERVIHSDAPPPEEIRSDVPSGLAAICMCAMARDREARYPTAGAMAEDLRRYLDGERPHARSGAALPVVPILVAAIVLLLSALGGVVAWRARNAPDHEQTARLAEARRELAALVAEIDGLTPDEAPGRRSALVERLEALERRSHGDDDLVRAVVAQRRRVEAQEDLARVRALARERRPFKILRPLFARAGAACMDDPAGLRRVERAMVRSLIRRGRSAEALGLLAKVPDDPEVLWLRGRALEGRRRREEARKVYGQLAGAGGSLGSLAKAAAHRLAGEHDSAAATAELAVEQGASTGHVELGLALLALGRPQRAELALTKAKESAPDDPRVYHGLGVVRLLEKKHEVALILFEQAESLLEVDLSLATTELRGLCLLRLGRKNSAKRALDTVLKADPERVEALVHQGVLSLQRGDAAATEQEWRRADALDRERTLAVVDRWHTTETARKLRGVIGVEVAKAPPEEGPSPVGPAPLGGAILTPQELLRRLLGGRRRGAVLPKLGTVPSSVTDRVDGRVDGLPAAQGRDLREALLRAARGEAWNRVSVPLERAYARDPKQPRVARERLRLLIAADDVAGARRALADAERAQLLTAAQVAWCRGEIAWRAGDVAAARKHYGDCGARDAAGALGRVARSRAALLAGDFASAGRSAAAATTMASDSAAAWLSLALSALGRRDLQTAQKAVNKAFGVVGARDSVLLACRAVLLASVQALRPGAARTQTAEAQLRLTSGPFARLLAAELALESRHAAVRTWGARGLARLEATCAKRAQWFRVTGYARTRAPEGTAAEAVAAWKRARALEPGVKLPAHYLEAFRRRFGASALGGLGD